MLEQLRVWCSRAMCEYLGICIAEDWHLHGLNCPTMRQEIEEEDAGE